MDYVEAFQNLKTNNKYSRKAPHKAVLLLAIIDMFESCELTDNVIKYDDALKSAFVKMWNKVLPNEATFHSEAYLPFWFMQSEGFWHIVPLRGKEDILTILKDSHVKPSESKLRDCVNYAELDEDLYFLMTLQSGRSSLKRALLETYTTLSTRMIDRLSESSDNFSDSSEKALNEYESIISSSEVNQSSTERKIDNELEERFSKLKEDIQYVLNIEYFTFLKKNINEREMFKEICPTVYDLYDRIAFNPIKQGEISPSISFTYENFLADLKITLMSEDGSFELIDKINEAISCLSSLESEQPEYSFDDEEEVEEVKTITEPTESVDVKTELRPLETALESRKGKPWTSNEEELITLYYKQGYDFDSIANAMGRTEVSIKSRLASLGLIEYSYEYDSYTPIANNEVSEEKSETPIDFFVENTGNRCSIFNRMGERVYSTTGKLKIFHGKVYRFNYKEICFTVKDIVRDENGNWEKGTKKLVAYSDTDLYPLLDKYNFIDQIEDFVEVSQMQFNKMSVDGKWYSFDGDCVGINTTAVKSIETEDDHVENLHPQKSANYVPKGKLKDIGEIVESSYDYLWLIAIIDFMGEKQHSSSLSYDELACMMIANAWEILADNPELKETETTIVDCIEFLIEESKEYMDVELSWSSPKEIVFDAIKDYPMAGSFEDAVDELLEYAPYNVLKAWIKEEDERDFVMFSVEYKNACLYALHPRKIDPYIEINPNWKKSLFFEHVDLMQYFQTKYIEYVQSL